MNDIFDRIHKPEFTYKEGIPTSIKFQITALDSTIPYTKKLEAEYSENVANKRSHIVSLKCKETKADALARIAKAKDSDDKDVPNIPIEFSIEFRENPNFGKKVEKGMPRRLDFDKDSSEQLKKKLRSDKYTSDQKLEIEEILDERGVKFETEEEEEEKLSDDEKAELLGNKNESFLARMGEIAFTGIIEDGKKVKGSVKIKSNINSKEDVEEIIKDEYGEIENLKLTSFNQL